jgi:hypothetical protein
LTAWAAVTTPADKPYCFLTVCGDSDCSFAMPMSLNYTRFTYNYRSPIDESDAVATFSVECTTSAYVALDDVSITNNALAASASSASLVFTATTTVFETETIVPSQILHAGRDNDVHQRVRDHSYNHDTHDCISNGQRSYHQY